MTRRDWANPGTILITGATGGIGRALARCYAAPTRTLVLQGREPERLHDLAATCRAWGAGEVETVTADLRDVDRWMTLLQALGARRRIDLAIVNAGVTSYVRDGAAGEDWEAIDDVLAINLRAALATVHAVLPSMQARGGGQVALISSLSAYFGLPVTPSYCASKAALKSYGESLRGGLAADGIAVNVVLPGFVETAMSKRFLGPKPFMLSPDAAASAIRKGLARNRPRISFPFPLSWGLWWLSVLPPDVSRRVLQALGYGGGARRRG